MFEFIKNIFRKNDRPFGLVIGDAYLQVLQLGGDAQNIVLKGCAERRLTSGIVVSGKVVQESMLVSEIRALLADARPAAIVGSDCIFALPDGNSFEYVFYLPAGLDEHEFKAQLDLLVGETIPFPLEQIYYVYNVSLHGQVQVVSVVASQRAVVDQYRRLLGQLCGFKPLVFEPAFLSLLRNVPRNFAGDSGTLLVDVNERRIEWFSFWDEDVFDANAILLTEAGTGYEILLDDLGKSLTLFEGKTGRKISGIVVTGSGSMLQAIVETLKKLKLPVELLSQYRFLPLLNDSSDAARFRVVSGLALKGIGVDIKTQINLLKN